MVVVKSKFYDATYLEQTESLAALLKKYWSVEIFWFPFNSLLDWVGNMVPTESGRQLNVAAFPEPPAADTKLVRNYAQSA